MPRVYVIFTKNERTISFPHAETKEIEIADELENEAALIRLITSAKNGEKISIAENADLRLVYYTAYISTELGIKYKDSFITWYASDKYYDRLVNLQYIFPIRKLYAKLINVSSLIIQCTASLIKSTELIVNYAEKVEAKHYLAELNPFDLFNELNERVREECARIEDTRSALGVHLLLTNTDEFRDYTKHTKRAIGEGETQYFHEDKCLVSEIPAFGEQQVWPKETVEERFNNFTHGILTKRPGFPFEKVAISGGCPLYISLKEKNHIDNSDVDIFIFGKDLDEKKKTYDEVLAYFEQEEAYFATKGISERAPVTNIYIKGVKRPFQVVCDDSIHPYDVIARFDVPSAKCMYYNGEVYFTASCADAIRYRQNAVSNEKRFSLKRAIKSIRKGFALIVKNESPFLKTVIDVLKRPDSAEYTSEFYIQCKPLSEIPMNGDEIETRAAIMNDVGTKTSNITKASSTIVDNIKFINAFENTYEDVNPAKFDPDTNARFGNVIKEKTSDKKIRFRLDNVKIFDICVMSKEVQFKITMTDDLRALIEKVRRNVKKEFYPTFDNIIEKPTLTLSITIDEIAAREKYNVVMSNKYGQKLVTLDNLDENSLYTLKFSFVFRHYQELVTCKVSEVIKMSGDKKRIIVVKTL